jgi:hypothetical protein
MIPRVRTRALTKSRSLIPSDHRDSDGLFEMVMRREREVQGDLVVMWAEMPRSRGALKLLNEAGFDSFVETICKPF